MPASVWICGSNLTAEHGCGFAWRHCRRLGRGCAATSPSAGQRGFWLLETLAGRTDDVAHAAGGPFSSGIDGLLVLNFTENVGEDALRDAAGLFRLRETGFLDLPEVIR
jgi:hypothetical protein